MKIEINSNSEMFLKILRNYGEVEFTFRKKDGSIRHAVGTLKPEVLRWAHEFKKATITPQTGASRIIKYWDCEKEAFRSCIVDNILAIENFK